MASHPTAPVLTRADLDDFPDDGRRRELLDGVLYVSPLARLDHQRVVGRLTTTLMNWIDAGGHGEVFPGANVDLGEDSHLEPDVVWTSRDGASGLGFDTAPDLVVEVLSPGTRRFDRGRKKDRYLASGCRECWIVDTEARTIEVFHADGVDTHADGDVFTSLLLPGLSLVVTDLLP